MTELSVNCFECKYRGDSRESPHLSFCEHPHPLKCEMKPDIQLAYFYESNWPFKYDPMIVHLCEGFEPIEDHPVGPGIPL